MKRKSVFLLTMFIMVSFLSSFAMSEDPVVEFLNALKTKQSKKAMQSFEDLNRTAWHFLPGAMWPRVGIQTKELDKEQKALFADMLSYFLSESGYKKTQDIIELENVLAEMSGNTEFRDAGRYYISFYGDPRTDSLWAWSFEGHHLSLNFTVSEGAIASTPRFFGASPAHIKHGPRAGDRTLAEEEDIAFELLSEFSDDQLKTVVFQKESFFDIVTSNASEVSALQAVGIQYSDMSGKQQELFQSLIMSYLKALPKKLARKRMDKITKDELDSVRFGWAGSTERGKPHYYRIQGQTFLIEYDNIQDDANHVHTVWRDFNGDFGRDLIREHYLHSDHHKSH